MNSQVDQLVERLNIQQKRKKVIDKANEFNRLLDLKYGGLPNNVT
jgi:hypothetical protein